MGFKNYFTASIILMALVAGFVYSLNLGSYTLLVDTKIQNYIFEQNLPIYIWIVLPVFILFILTVLHMSFYGSKGYFAKKALSCDINTINDYIQKRLLNEKSNKKLKTKEFKQLGVILNQLDIDIKNDEFNCEDDSINNIVNKVKDIKKDNYVVTKSLKLDANNPIEIQNLKNRIKKDDNFALEVLKNGSKYDDDIIKLAYDLVLQNKSIDRIKNVVENLNMTNDMVAALLLKDSKLSAEQRYTNTQILQLIQDNKLSNQDLIQIAINYKKTMQPEQLIKLFEEIAANDESLTESYLYVLFQYEMLTQIKEILDNSQKNEYTVFKALIDLKDAGKHYSVESLCL